MAVPALLSTGAAARLLGVSRQHVVDLCERGALPSIRVGTHRRITRHALDAYRTTGTVTLTRAQTRQLWIHRALLATLLADPEHVLATARSRAVEKRDRPGPAATTRPHKQWARIIDAGIEAVIDTLLSRSPDAVALREHSPFEHVLPHDVERAVIKAADSWWRHQRHPETPTPIPRPQRTPSRPRAILSQR